MRPLARNARFLVGSKSACSKRGIPLFPNTLIPTVYCRGKHLRRDRSPDGDMQDLFPRSPFMEKPSFPIAFVLAKPSSRVLRLLRSESPLGLRRESSRRRLLSMRIRPLMLAYGVMLTLGMAGPALAQDNGVQQPSARQQLQHIHTPQSIYQELAHLTKDLELTSEQQ